MVRTLRLLNGLQWIRPLLEEVAGHCGGAVAAWVQEDLEELSHVEGQEGRR